MGPLIDSSLLMHIGLHKTGSTWLQHQLFSQSKTGFYGPTPDSGRGNQVKHIGRMLTTDKNGRLLNEDEFDAYEFRDSLSNLMVRHGLCPAISYERLGGHPFSNGFDRTMLCRRIKAVFPSALILICIREQRSMIMSNYMQYLHYGGWHTLDGYINPQCDARQPALDLQFWAYHRLISLYLEVFGSERVLVLPYEELAESPNHFINKIREFAALPPQECSIDARAVNVRKPHFSSYRLRRLGSLRFPSSTNAFFPSVLGRRTANFVDSTVRSAVDRLTPNALEVRTRLALEHRVDRLTKGYFTASNRTTQDLTGLNLGRYGYQL